MQADLPIFCAHYCYTTQVSSALRYDRRLHFRSLKPGFSVIRTSVKSLTFGQASQYSSFNRLEANRLHYNRSKYSWSKATFGPNLRCARNEDRGRLNHGPSAVAQEIRDLQRYRKAFILGLTSDNRRISPKMRRFAGISSETNSQAGNATVHRQLRKIAS